MSERRGMVCKIRDRCVKQRCPMGLTVKQNEFVVEIVGGASQTLAYRSAYNNQSIVPEDYLGRSLAAQEASQSCSKNN